jgi:hypothetical protein
MHGLHVFQIKEDGVDEACITCEEMRSAYKISVTKPEGKRPLDIDARKILKWALK